MKKILIVLLSIFVVSNLNAQTLSEFINRIHTQLLTGVSLKTVKGQMAAYQIIDSAVDESGDKIFIYRVSDKYKVSYWFGSDNRVKFIDLNVAGIVDDYDVESNGFWLYSFEDDYSLLTYKNELSKTELLICRIPGPMNFSLSIMKDVGFRYMTVHEYKVLLEKDMEMRRQEAAY